MTFKKVHGQWYGINDDNCYTFTEEQIMCLTGVDGCEKLWELTPGYKLVARLLIYAENDYEIK